MTGVSRSSDGIIKHLLENARFTGFLLTRILPEMKGVSLDQFCTYTKTDVDTGESLKQEATEVTSAGIKDTRFDLIFNYNAESKILLRINEEPQTSQESYSENTQDSYSLIARAVYYASLAMVTELHSKEEYHKIHKVYSVWICYKRPIPYIQEPIISYSLKPDQEYLYTDKTSINTCKHKFDNGDLMGIVLISVPDLENYVKQGKDTEKYALNILSDLYYLLSNKISIDDRMEFYKNTSIVKEGTEMVSSITALEYAEEIKRQAEEQIQRAEQQKRQAEEQILKAEQQKRQAEEQILKAEEKVQKAEEQVQKAEEKVQKAEEKVQKAEEICVRTECDLGNQLGWSKDQIVQKIAELLQVKYDYAQELLEYYIS